MNHVTSIIIDNCSFFSLSCQSLFCFVSEFVSDKSQQVCSAIRSDTKQFETLSCFAPTTTGLCLINGKLGIVRL